MYYDFKVKVMSKNNALKRSHEMMEKIHQFLVSSTDEIILQTTIDGILMIVPVSKQYNVAAYNYFKSLYSPQVLLYQLPIKFASQNPFDDLSTINEKINDNDTTEKFLHSVYGDDNNVEEMNLNFSDTSSSMDTSSSSSEEIASIKLEPDVEIDESDENKMVMSKEEEEKYFLDNIRKTGKLQKFICMICDKKFRCIPGAKVHIKNFHLNKKRGLKRDLLGVANSVLTEDEIQFINQNLIITKNGSTSYSCNICLENSTNNYKIRNHILMAHMNKKRIEFDINVMKKKLIREGSNKEGIFQCVICYDNYNPIEFDRKDNLISHLSQHTRSTIRSYANFEKENFVEPSHKFFDHPLSML